MDLAPRQTRPGHPIASPRQDDGLRLGRLSIEVPADTSKTSRASLESIKRWHKGGDRELSNELELELESTKRAIASQERALDSVAEEDALERLQILSELSALIDVIRVGANPSHSLLRFGCPLVRMKWGSARTPTTPVPALPR
jgi:hypothetical protein